MRRERERQLEVLVELQGFCAVPDFEETAWRIWRAENDAANLHYQERKLFDPGSIRLQIEKQRLRRQPRTKRRLRNRDAREVRRMYEAGAPLKAISKAFGGITPTSIGKILSGALHPGAGGYIHPKGATASGKPARLARGFAHGRNVLSAEVVARVLARPKASHAELGRELNISHETVRRIRKGDTWFQRAQRAQAAE
jgi:hypothetical protein